MMVVIRYISMVLVWIITVLVVIGSIGNLQKHLLQCVDARQKERASFGVRGHA